MGHLSTGGVPGSGPSAPQAKRSPLWVETRDVPTSSLPLPSAPRPERAGDLGKSLASIIHHCRRQGPRRSHGLPPLTRVRVWLSVSGSPVIGTGPTVGRRPPVVSPPPAPAPPSPAADRSARGVDAPGVRHPPEGSVRQGLAAPPRRPRAPRVDVRGQDVRDVRADAAPRRPRPPRPRSVGGPRRVDGRARARRWGPAVRDAVVADPEPRASSIRAGPGATTPRAPRRPAPGVGGAERAGGRPRYRAVDVFRRHAEESLVWTAAKMGHV